jgi:prepilin-type N-terminal cleavage/methylation domain-containing protein
MVQMEFRGGMERIKTLTVGSLNKNQEKSGFTFLELIVVISIVSVLLFLSIPVFNKIAIFSTPSGHIRDMVRLMENLKARAIKENTDFTLHLQPGSALFWVTHINMNEEAMQEAEDNATALSDDIVFLELVYPGIQQTSNQEHRLMFHKEGYSDFAILHVTDKNTNISLKLEPFLSTVQVIDGHASFEDCN